MNVLNVIYVKQCRREEIETISSCGTHHVLPCFYTFLQSNIARCALSNNDEFKPLSKSLVAEFLKAKVIKSQNENENRN